MTLRKEIDSLLYNYQMDEKGKRYQRKRYAVCQILKSKIKRINSRLGRNAIEPWDNYLMNNESLFYNRCYEYDFELLKSSDHVIIFHYSAKSKSIIFSSKNGGDISACRTDCSIAFHNPINQSFEAWGSFYSASNLVDYPKHLYEKGYTGEEGKYIKNISPEELEVCAMKNGIGYLVNDSKALFFISFNRSIGTFDSSGRRVETNILKVQADRTSRGKRKYINKKGNKLTRRQGYFVKLHGYPISAQKLMEDFPFKSNDVSRICFNI